MKKYKLTQEQYDFIYIKDERNKVLLPFLEFYQLTCLLEYRFARKDNTVPTLSVTLESTVLFGSALFVESPLEYAKK